MEKLIGNLSANWAVRREFLRSLKSARVLDRFERAFMYGELRDTESPIAVNRNGKIARVAQRRSFYGVA